MVESGLNEAEQRILMGWRPTSKTPAKYTHLTGNKVLKKLIEVEGHKKFYNESDVKNRIEQERQQWMAEIQKENEQRMKNFEQKLTEKLLLAFEKLTPQQQELFNPRTSPDEMVKQQLVIQ